MLNLANYKIYTELCEPGETPIVTCPSCKKKVLLNHYHNTCYWCGRSIVRINSNQFLVVEDMENFKMQEITIEYKGVKMTGTPDNLLAAGVPRDIVNTALGPLYLSESHGLVSIRGMNTYHIINALRKKHVEFLNATYSLISNGKFTATTKYEFLDTLEQGPTTNQEFADLLDELFKRDL